MLGLLTSFSKVRSIDEVSYHCSWRL